MRAAFFVTFALIAGCSSSFERIQTMRDSAPEWYDARKYEIRGEDYPRISEIPLLTGDDVPGGQIDQSGAGALAIYEAMMRDPRSTLAEESPEDILAWARDVRRAVEGQLPAPDFLTDEDVAALKAIFDTPRARL